MRLVSIRMHGVSAHDYDVYRPLDLGSDVNASSILSDGRCTSGVCADSTLFLTAPELQEFIIKKSCPVTDSCHMQGRHYHPSLMVPWHISSSSPVAFPLCNVRCFAFFRHLRLCSKNAGCGNQAGASESHSRKAQPVRALPGPPLP